ncbi:LCP family protein [Treponema sp.]|uniref:LCP family protein n=1 Tax=Treponema sp. TaxID=166 RepID=UPI0025FA7403|nr:LCP family protein [Treponema sp.]MCR5219271.1 LCP family protein [Treponema sp.]
MNYSSSKKNVIFLLVILVLLLGATAFFFFSIKIDAVNDILKNNNSIVSILWILKDEDETMASEILVMYPPTKKSALFDIPANTGGIYHTLERVDRLDQVYKEKGYKAFKKEVEGITGRELPFVIEVTLDDFASLTDILGGLKIFVSDPVFTKDESGQYFMFPSGGVTLDGDKIRSYLRYRAEGENENFVKDRRQNTLISFFSALMDNSSTILKGDDFSLYSHYFKGHINDRNLDDEELLKVLSLLLKMDSDRITTNSITGTTNIVDGKQLLFPEDNGNRIKKVLNLTVTTLLSEEMSAQSRVYVLKILNGTERAGLASRTSKMFRDAGYETLPEGNAEKNYEYTTIVSHIGNYKSAETIGSFIRCSNIVEDEIDATGLQAGSATADFTIILGEDFNGTYATSGYTGTNKAGE